MASKASTQKRHARRRAYERFGVELTQSVVVPIRKAIEEGRAPLLHRQSHRVGLYLVDLAGRKALAVYDRNRKVVVTFLDEHTDQWRDYVEPGLLAGDHNQAEPPGGGQLAQALAGYDPEPDR